MHTQNPSKIIQITSVVPVDQTGKAPDFSLFALTETGQIFMFRSDLYDWKEIPKIQDSLCDVKVGKNG